MLLTFCFTSISSLADVNAVAGSFVAAAPTLDSIKTGELLTPSPSSVPPCYYTGTSFYRINQRNVVNRIIFFPFRLV